MPEIKNSFLERARYEKGRKTLQAILDATFELIAAGGPAAASQQAIADRAKVSQSAVRHYFKTKEDLLEAFFASASETMHAAYLSKQKESGGDPRTLLLEWAKLHYRRINTAKSAVFLEATAYTQRNAKFCSIRDAWYQWLVQHYQQLIGMMHPEWDAQRCRDTSFQVLTLIMGGWVTAGDSRPEFLQQSSPELTAILLRGIERLIDA
jgi:AcrR family transcriptional regulator